MANGDKSIGLLEEDWCQSGNGLLNSCRAYYVRAKSISVAACTFQRLVGCRRGCDATGPKKNGARQPTKSDKTVEIGEEIGGVWTMADGYTITCDGRMFLEKIATAVSLPPKRQEARLAIMQQSVGTTVERPARGLPTAWRPIS